MTTKTRFKMTLLSLIIVAGFSFYALAKDMEGLAGQGLAAIMVIVPVFIAGDSLRKSGTEGRIKSDLPTTMAEVDEKLDAIASSKPKVKIVGGKRVPV